MSLWGEISCSNRNIWYFLCPIEGQFYITYKQLRVLPSSCNMTHLSSFMTIYDGCNEYYKQLQTIPRVTLSQFTNHSSLESCLETLSIVDNILALFNFKVFKAINIICIWCVLVLHSAPEDMKVKEQFRKKNLGTRKRKTVSMQIWSKYIMYMYENIIIKPTIHN